MKYYSEYTGKAYDTEFECLNDERLEIDKAENEKKKKEKLKAQRKDRANEVEETIEKYNEIMTECNKVVADAKKTCDSEISEAEKKYRAVIDDCREKIDDADKKVEELVSAFTRDYGGFNYTIKTTSTGTHKSSTLFDPFKFFNIFYL